MARRCDGRGGSGTNGRKLGRMTFGFAGGNAYFCAMESLKTKAMETSINLTNYYWDLLKSLSDDVKLRLATRLTASVLEHRKDEATTDLTEKMLAKHAGKWIDDRSAEEIISDMRKSRSAIK